MLKSTAPAKAAPTTQRKEQSCKSRASHICGFLPRGCIMNAFIFCVCVMTDLLVVLATQVVGSA
jgi:hypothetical protein